MPCFPSRKRTEKTPAAGPPAMDVLLTFQSCPSPLQYTRPGSTPPEATYHRPAAASIHVPEAAKPNSPSSAAGIP
ncbi:unnamed protein product [Periconia digitata]|uniref:Uncharacterized protein n=1 Tax=Periconia digitata TaxID=1303443 RepID=A0A9W4UM06_9PLEO|nr:unnamed protein product [Periconia digitata]